MSAPELARSESEADERILERARRIRHWPLGSVKQCPDCKKRTFAGRDDLVERIIRPGTVYVFGRLHGGKCSSCGYQIIENEDLFRIEEEAGVGRPATFEVGVYTKGTNVIGTNWTRDMVRSFGLRSGQRALVHYLDERTAVIEFGVSGRPEPGAARKGRKKAAPMVAR
jgi:hypothetical protein